MAASEVPEVLRKKNRASALLALQSEELKRCAEARQVTEYQYVERVRMLATLYEKQGKCERSKTFRIRASSRR